MDDWNLVRTLDGKVGWVLTRPLSMAIPDEVAQYAEGHRITGRVEAQALAHHEVIPPHNPSPTERNLTALNLQLLNTDDSAARGDSRRYTAPSSSLIMAGPPTIRHPPQYR